MTSKVRTQLPNEGYNLGSGAYVSPNLTVDDICKMAQSGVKVDLDTIKDRIVFTPPDARPPLMAYDPSVDPVTGRTKLDHFFLERYRRGKNLPFSTQGDLLPFDFHLAERGDTVYLFILMWEGAPVVLEDKRQLFPSDALMASVFLLLETQPSKPYNDITDAAAQGAAQMAQAAMPYGKPVP